MARVQEEVVKLTEGRKVEVMAEEAKRVRAEEESVKAIAAVEDKVSMEVRRLEDELHRVRGGLYGI